MAKTTVEISGARGTKHVKSTGMDTSSMKVPGTDASTQLRNSGMGGHKDNISHSIGSGGKIGQHCD